MDKIYNGKYTLINGTDSMINVPTDFYVYELDKYTLTHIKNQEIFTHKLFCGHVVIKKDLKLDFEKIKSLDLSQNKVYSTAVFHSGILSQCAVNLNLIICSSWMLPFVLDSKCDYGYLRKHRAKLLTYKTITLV